MDNKPQPVALKLAEMLPANEWLGHVTLVSYARECVAELLTQHAHITELESQLAQRFDAADMATAAAQGFRDGVASLSANAGEPRKVFLVATGEEHEGEATYTRYDDQPPPLCDSECLFAAPPTAQAKGWRLIETAPQDGRTLLLGYFNSAGKWRTIRGEWLSQDHIYEYAEDPDCMSPGWHETTVEDDDGKCRPIDPTHWMPLPAAPALLMERAMNFVELKRKDGTRFLIDFHSHWEIDDRGGNPALWQNHEQARNMNCANTYDEVRAKLLKKEDQ